MIKRIEFLDATRGIAAFFVLLSHVLEVNIPLWEENTFKYFNMGQMGVSAFFLVSGFIIPASLGKSKSIKHFFISRLFRIYPLYFTILFINFIIIFFYNRQQVDVMINNLPVNVFSNIFFLQTYLDSKFTIVDLVPGSWTLLIELLWYILFSLLYYFNFNKSHKKIFIYSNILMAFFTIVGLLLGKRLPYGVLSMIFACVLGLFTYRYYNGEITYKRFVNYTGVSILNILVGFFVNFYVFENLRFTFLCVISSWTIGFMLFYGFFMYIGKIRHLIKLNQTFKELGIVSYSLYLVHPTVMKISSIIQLHGLYAITFAVIVSLLLAYFIYRIIELPGIKLGKKLAYSSIPKKEHVIN